MNRFHIKQRVNIYLNKEETFFKGPFSNAWDDVDISTGWKLHLIAWLLLHEGRIEWIIDGDLGDSNKSWKIDAETASISKSLM